MRAADPVVTLQGCGRCAAVRMAGLRRDGRHFAVATILLALTAATCSPEPLAQATATGSATPQTLAAFVNSLPEDVQPDGTGNPAFLTQVESLSKVTAAERDAAMPQLMQRVDDNRPAVRTLALFVLWALYQPQPGPQGAPAALPQQYLPRVVAHLHDAVPDVRPLAMLALQPVLFHPSSRDELLALVLPLLQAPDALVAYPDHRNDVIHARLIAKLPPSAQAQFAAQYRQPMYPALGPELLWLVLRPGSTQQDDAILAFLDRTDQTPDTLSESLRAIALNRGSERVANEALRRVFAQHAMSVFLLQFVSNLALTPAEVAAFQPQLLALAADPSTEPQLRHAATTVTACWSAASRGTCRPDSENFVTHGQPQRGPAR